MKLSSNRAVSLYRAQNDFDCLLIYIDINYHLRNRTIFSPSQYVPSACFIW